MEIRKTKRPYGCLFYLKPPTRNPGTLLYEIAFFFSHLSGIILKHSYITKCSVQCRPFFRFSNLYQSLFASTQWPICCIHNNDNDNNNNNNSHDLFPSNSAYCVVFCLSFILIFRALCSIAVFPTSTGVTVYSRVYKWI